MADDTLFEKYGVLQNEERKKEASVTNNELHCPACGAVLEPLKDRNVYKCPQCGTRPFENHVNT